MTSLQMLEDLDACGVRPTVRLTDAGGVAEFGSFAENSKGAWPRWTIHFGSDDGVLGWMVVRDERSGVEIHVADLSRMQDEPVLERLADNLRRDTGLR